MRRPFPSACTNDGLQFHLSQFHGTEKSGGRWGLPYDQGNHNVYRLAGETADIAQWHMSIYTYGNNMDQTQVVISRVQDKKEQLVFQQTQLVTVYASMLIPARQPSYPLLKKDIVITRYPCHYRFDYGDPNNDGLRWFGFDSTDTGYERFPKTSNADRPGGQYCGTTDLDPTEWRGPGKRIRCDFPAW